LSVMGSPKKEIRRKASALTIPRGGAVSTGNEFAAKLLVSALVTLVFEGSCGHICEFLKVCKEGCCEFITHYVPNRPPVHLTP
jgi:hypothetical protein